MRLAFSAATAALLIGVVGCTLRTHHTIDARIQVDVRYVEEQAEDVLDFIEGESDELTIKQKPQSRMLPEYVNDAIEFLMPIRPVHAQEMKSDSPKIRELAQSMRERNSEIDSWKQKGCMGEDNRGYVEVLDCADLENDPEAKNEVQKLKTEENNDRKEMYNEFARLNKDINLTVSQVERIFAKKRMERAKSGEWFQLPPEGSDFDAFKNSSLGKRLGTQAKPGAWVKIP